jgi:predicted ribosomally synthesized peptide with nif11-like leader
METRPGPDEWNGLRSAHGFVQRARTDAALRESIRAAADLGALVQVGREHGFQFTVSELRLAFSQDWTMRRLRYGPRAS